MITLAAGSISVADDPHTVHHPTARGAGSDRARLWASAHFKVRPLFPNKRLTCRRMPIEVQHNLGALFAAL